MYALHVYITAYSVPVKFDSVPWQNLEDQCEEICPSADSCGDDALRLGWNREKLQPVVPVVPRTVIKEVVWSRFQRLAECSFPITMNYETNVVPRSELHDLAKKAWCVL